MSTRMGRLPEQPVPWEEVDLLHAASLSGEIFRLYVQVNAAWGQACLLLDALVCSL